MSFSDFVVPVIFAGVLIFGLIKRVDVYGEFVAGVREGLLTVRDIFPSLLALVVAVGMLRASGTLEALAALLSPVTELFGFPKECTPLLLIRPFSGSGALAAAKGILTENGADSLVGKITSVMLGSSETTFYTIAVYFAATKIKKTRHTLPSALTGDILIGLFSAVAVRLLL